MEQTIRGIGVSPGIAIGPTLIYGARTFDVPKYPIHDPRTELVRFERAVEAVRAELERVYERTSEILGAEHAEIFKAHLLFLDDVAFREEVERRLLEERINAEYLIEDFMRRYAKAMESLPDPLFRERGQDVADVSNRLLGKLLNTDLESLEHLERESIIAARDISPSEAAKIDLKNALAIALDASGPTSHSAILARALEVPAVVGLRTLSSTASPGDTVIVDGGRGRVIVRPTQETLARYAAEKKRQARHRAALLALGSKPCKTIDRYEVPLMANIELPVELPLSRKVHAQGIGLFRTEYLFLNRSVLPTENEQFEAYAEVARSAAPATVTLRTLDLGGDKFITQLHATEESNPQLGWRAIRLCLDRVDIFKKQLRAMYRASVHGNVEIMFPLISGLDELRKAKQIAEDVRKELAKERVKFDPNVRIGTMIEVPSAVEIADLLASECDFFSIGTNDLIQYSLAVDRVNERIAHMYEPSHPAVLRMIRRTIRAANAAGIPCSICGEMAGDPLFTELLVGMGVTSLSMSSIAIPEVRAELLSIRYSTAKRFVAQILRMGTGSEIRESMEARRRDRRPAKSNDEASVVAQTTAAED